MAYDTSYSVSVDERMAADPVTLDELDEAWQSYMDEADNIQTRTRRAPSDPLDAMTDYLIASGQNKFEVRIADSYFYGCLTDSIDVGKIAYLVMPFVYKNIPYREFDKFSSPRKLVDHFLTICDYGPMDDDEDPLNFIYTSSGKKSKSWARIMQDITNLE